MAKETIVNPEPRKPDDLNNIACRDSLSLGANLAGRDNQNSSHGAVCTAGRDWDQ